MIDISYLHGELKHALVDGFHPHGQVMSLYLCRGDLSWAALEVCGNSGTTCAWGREKGGSCARKLAHGGIKGHFINPSHILQVPILPEGQEIKLNQKRIGKGGQTSDCMPPSSISSLHFSDSFPCGGMPRMWVVGKAFENRPGDKNALVLKASLLTRRRCIEGSCLPFLLNFCNLPALPRLAG